jgi:hypothetical protein
VDLVLDCGRNEQSEEFKLSSSDIETIYQTYPRHKDKRFALVSIEKALLRIQRGETGKPMTWEAAVEYLLDRTSAFARSPAGGRGAMTAYPATWMNRGGYMDDPEEWEHLTPEEFRQAKLSAEANIGVYRP